MPMPTLIPFHSLDGATTRRNRFCGQKLLLNLYFQYCNPQRHICGPKRFWRCINYINYLSASEVTTLWHYTNLFIIIIIFLNLGRSSRGGRQKLILEIIALMVNHPSGSHQQSSRAAG